VALSPRKTDNQFWNGMDDHFRAYTFVDRITSIENEGLRIRGTYAIPSDLETFPTALLAEAVGQLAAWAAMSAVKFERRPVAGIAGAVEFLGPVKPGQTLELEADLESVDAQAVAYGGTAYLDGNPVIRLERCVGPMLPLEEFEDPKAARERFDLLRGEGADTGGFRGIPALSLERIGGEPGKSMRANLQVPAAAPLFVDHFPRRPVFPGTLLMHMNLQLAAELAKEIPSLANGASWTLRKLSNVKLRAFIPPGDKLELEVKLMERLDDSATIGVEIRKDGRKIGGARLLLLRENQ
jgi:3-hydroxymyristoyl/3-hydroxydecanoyl-(acyl carrier protein) dehydratase